MTYDASDEAKGQPLIIGGFTIDEMIALHLEICTQCRDTAERAGPVRMGEHSRHCGTYWQLQLDRAMYEGRVNNIVAYTENGDEAPIRGKLE
jgi:hypothetical protein